MCLWEKRIFLNEVLPRISDRILFGGLEVKPGSPSKCAIINGKPLLALSGESFCGSSSVELLWQTDGQCADGKPVAGM